VWLCLSRRLEYCWLVIWSLDVVGPVAVVVLSGYFFSFCFCLC